ncbi:MAG: peptide deformylase [Myxococcales bacterium]|nr:peptide deformylase [Myxococcales bacterium]
MPAAAPVLVLGDPRLRVPARSIALASSTDLADARAELLATLAAFRREHGFGRAIAAPQIGRDLRLIALNLGDARGAFTIGDPVLTWASDATITLWDDCMSLPDMMVKVRRRRSISLRFVDEAGATQTWERLPPTLAELLQHELDHLDGILMLDRQELGSTPITRDLYVRERARFDAEVDLTITPTI